MSILEINLIYAAIPMFTILLIVEFIVYRRTQPEHYNLKDAVTSISMGLGNLVSSLLSKGMIVAVFFLLYSHRIFDIPISWWSWLLLFFAEDLCYYTMHRSSHRIRFFWASHVVHHSSQHYNLSTALRQTWTGSFCTFVFWLWLPLLGFHPLMILAQMSISLIYQYWIHTETITRLPRWFETVFNTPSHHRVHHATNPRYLDRNHAGILIIWDKLFNSFEAEHRDEKTIYGLTQNIDTFNPIKIATHEWLALGKTLFTTKLTMLDRIKYLVMPPGWKHDGSGKMATEIRREWEANQ